MSFWPLPTSLLEALRAAAHRGPIVDLGAGDGVLGQHLREIGIETILVDRRLAPGRWAGAAVRADVRKLPFRSFSIELAILANVLRHAKAPERRSIVDELDRALSPSGRLVVLEDLPAAHSQSARNYRRALELLARADPSRGAAVGPEAVAPALEIRFQDLELSGTAENRVKVQEPEQPLRWLQARLMGARDGDLEELLRDVRSSGMSYGSYWDRVYRRQVA
jgi:SAM-dependent methyltransferase